jgi:hypothetical protein
MLSGDRQLAVARAVEALMGNQPCTETEEFAYFDPKVGQVVQVDPELESA